MSLNFKASNMRIEFQLQKSSKTMTLVGLEKGRLMAFEIKSVKKCVSKFGYN